MTPLVQVVPHLPPTISGVGDYALWLAEELRGAHDIDTRFVVGNPKWSGPPEVNGFPVFKLESRAAKPFAQLLAQTASPVVPSSRGPVFPLLLHYVGYGYQKRGCPFWLARGLEAWRREQGMRRLVTMFHELYASGPIWASSFWTSPFQRGLAASVARISDRCWTNRRLSADELGGLAPAHLGRVEVFPVFSNFGEPKNSPPLRQRPAQAVMFGTFGRAVRNTAQAQAAVSRACRHLGIEKLVVVGGDELLMNGGGVAVERIASLGPEQATRLLAGSRTGLLDYFDGYLGKSSIFAAYCSHGLAPVLLARNESQADGLEAGQHFLVAQFLGQEVRVAEQQRIADAALAWYSSHTLARMSDAIAKAVSPK